MSKVQVFTLVVSGLLLSAPSSRTLAQKVPPGFKVDLVYEVPDIEHPSAVTCDAEGNLFVAENPMDMRGPSTSLIDRIVYIRWDDSGGPPLKTVFCEKLSAVFGLLWHQGALYVMNAPYYTMLKDIDGDGVADVREELVDSLGHPPGLFGLNNHIPSGMRLGLDGLLYISVGDKGIPAATGADGSTMTLEGGGVVRMRPDGTELELVSSGIRNHTDVALDRFDNLFAYDNDDDFGWWTRILHHVPTGYYGYPYDYRSSHGASYLPPVRELGSGTPCGGAFYRESAWPDTYRDCAFFCEWGESKIERFTLTRKGASFDCRVEDFMLGDGSGEFRPIDLCFSPDGEHMYVADWNFAGGGESTRLGRLFRVTYVGDEVPAEPRRATDAAPLEAQIRSLGHPAHHERLRAQQRLAAMGEAAVGPIASLLDSAGPLLARVHALWTQNALLDQLDGYDPSPQWIVALGDSNPDIRCQAARALGYRRVQSAVGALADALKDADAAVRMRAAIALGRIGHHSSAEPLFGALGEQDPFAQFTMIQALRSINNWKPALRQLRATDPETRSVIVRTLSGVYDEVAVSVLDDWFRQTTDLDERAAVLKALAMAHRKADPYTGGWWGGQAAAGKPARPKEHAWAATETILKAIEAGLQQPSARIRLAALETLRDVPAPAAWPVVRALVSDDPDEEVRRAAIALLAELKDTQIVASLLSVASDREASDPLRQEAIRGIAEIGSADVDSRLAEIALADDLTDPLASVVLKALATLGTQAARETIERRMDYPRPEWRVAAIRAYSSFQGDDVVARTIRKLEDPDATVRRAALIELGQSRARQAVPAMIGAAADPKVRPEAIEALGSIPDRRALAIYLDGLLDKNQSIRDVSRRALSTLGDSIADDLRSLEERGELSVLVRQELTRIFSAGSGAYSFPRGKTPAKHEPSVYAKYATDHRGDSERGQRLFADPEGIGCAKCHAVGGAGSTIGPNLFGVGTKYPRRELIRAVLEPSSTILTDYETLVVVTTSGQVHTGVVKSQTPDETAVTTTEGEVVQIPAEQIEIKTMSPLSLMPDGLADDMTLQDFADIVAFLASLVEPQPSAGRHSP